MKRRVGIAAAAIGALALVGTAAVVPATASENAPDGTRVTRTEPASTAGSEQSAEAAQRGNGYFIASGVNIRTGPATNRTILGQGQKNQPIQVHSCRHGNPSSWWYITNLATGVKGYVYWPENVLFRSGVPLPPSC